MLHKDQRSLLCVSLFQKKKGYSGFDAETAVKNYSVDFGSSFLRKTKLKPTVNRGIR